MFKRIIAIILCIAMALTFTACGPEPATSSSTSKVDLTPTNKTIKVSWFLPWWIEDQEDKEFIFNEFNRLHPDYTVENEPLSTLTELVSAIQANNQPDMWMGGDMNESNFYAGLYKNVFSSIDYYYENDPDVNFDTLDKSQIDLGKFYDKYYALTYQSAQWCMLYNKKLFNEAGLDPEKPPTNFTELKEFSKKLTKFDTQGKITQYGISNDYGYNMPFAYQLGNLNKIGPLAADGYTMDPNSDWMLYVNQYCGSYKDDIFKEFEAAEGIKNRFSEGTVAIYFNGNLTMLNEEAKALGKDLGIAKYPHPDDMTEQIVPSAIWYYLTIPKGATNPNGGWFFAKYAMTDGLYKSASMDFDDNPTNTFPQYIAHIPTRERIYNDFLQNIDPDIRSLIDKRDAMMVDNVFIVRSSPLCETYEKIQKQENKKADEKKITIKEALDNIESLYNLEISKWKEQQIALGWTFPEGQLPVPPANY